MLDLIGWPQLELSVEVSCLCWGH